MIPTAQAALLDLADSPLFLGSNVDPNVFFQLDDSGSMDWSVLSKPYWHHCAYDPNATGFYSSSTNCGWLVDNGLIRSYSGGYRYFTYLWENSGNIYSDNCWNSDRNSVSACSSAGDKEWRFFSSDLNLTYYNPGLEYAPWNGECSSGVACANATFTSARSNPKNGETGYSDTRNLTGARYNVWIDNKGYTSSDGRPYRAGALNVTTTPNNEIDLWDSHYEVTLNSANIEIRAIDYTPNASGMGETNNVVATLTDTSACYNILGPKSLVQNIFDGSLSVTSTGGAGCKNINSAKQNFANWYQYSRKRSYVAKSAISQVMNQYPNFRYGLSVINNYGSLFKEVPSSGTTDYTSHNANLLSSLYSYNWTASGTPLRRGLERVGRYFDDNLSGKADPITNSCQQNFSILFTDGFWNGSSPASGIGNADSDGNSITVADVAKYYYDKDLSPLDNQVIPNPFDPATYQHMVTYTVAFGVSGNLLDSDGDGWPNPSLIESDNWGNPFSSDPEKIDDLWHAAFNAKGTFVAAQSPEDVTRELGNALSSISNRVSSAATVAQNSTVLSANSQVYQARFDSNSWTGELLAYPIDVNGVLAQVPVWNANCKLSGGDCALPVIDAAQNPGKNHSSRVIITRAWDGSNSGTAFDFPSSYGSLFVSGALPERISNFMQYSPYNLTTTSPAEIAANQTYVDHLLDYSRGDRSQEQQNSGSESFRNRQGILGDIIHSSPIYVAPPNRYFSDTFETSAYSTFKSTYQNRIPMVYTGSNDGMLHGFRSDTGEELLAYIPGNREVYKNISELSKSTYQHGYAVDGSPSESDVFINSSWRTILAGGLNKGGQTVYALDITDPSTFTEANANQIYLWEFSDEDDADLGYVYGQVKIAKVRFNSTESKWAIIFGNGYNNSAADGHASTNGEAALFVLFIERGLDGTWTADSDYIKITAGTAGSVTTPNGLGEPYLVDLDGDYIVDYVYAADLKGTVWKFNLQDTTPTNWKTNASALFNAQYASAGDQAITAPPIVASHPSGLSYGVMVYFGTGKYLENTDNTSTGAVTQTYYGLWDKLDGTTILKSNLLQQTILAEYNQGFDTDDDGTNDTTALLRQVSDNAINWQAPQQAGDPAQHHGWYLDLFVQGAASNLGERQISRTLVRNKNVIFTTLLPSQSPCEFGGSSWLMEVNMETGGQPEYTPFDLNNDGEFNESDYINIGDPDGDGNDNFVPAGGRKSDVGITPSPAVFIAEDKSKETKVTSGSMGLGTVEENLNGGPLGRQNWKQITQ
tara:strand:+ start:48926 stop:52732 length:3807 start_codon:yes stop_codon:yes gene_type:complete